MQLRTLILVLAVGGSATVHAQTPDVRIHIEVYDRAQDLTPAPPAAPAPPPAAAPAPAPVPASCACDAQVPPAPPAPAPIFAPAPTPAPDVRLVPVYATPGYPVAAPQYSLVDDRLELRRRLQGTSLGGPIALFSAGLALTVSSTMLSLDGAIEEGASVALASVGVTLVITGLVMWIRRARTRRGIVTAYRAERRQVAVDAAGIHF